MQVREEDPPRIPTGVQGLDTILRGGLIRGAGYLVVGEPGAGKTILCNQICFSHVAGGGRALYMTVLAESHTRMLTYLRSLDFFDEDPIGDALVYLSGYSTVAQAGLRGLLELLRSEVRTHQATLLVIDGLSTLEGSAASYLEFKRFVSDLQTSLDMLGCTTILQAQPSIDDRTTVIHTIVDGVIRLFDHRVGLYAVRELEIQKLRGSDSLRGRHQFEITSAGLVVHPRTEAVYAETIALGPKTRGRVRFGSSRLDEMLHGGLLTGSSTLVLGPPGSGKTLLGLHLLAEGARAGEQGLYFGFYESPAYLVEKAEGIGLELRDAVERGRLDILWQPAIENGLDELAERLLTMVKERKVKRLVVDGLRAFERAAVYAERIGPFFTALSARLRMLEVTTIFTYTLPELFAPSVTVLAPGTEEVDNMILLRYVELRSQLYRLISLVKIRDSDYEPAVREFTIGSDGLQVSSTFESAENILTGRARPKQGQGQRTKRR